MKKRLLFIFCFIMLINFGFLLGLTALAAEGSTVDLSEVNPLGVSGVGGISILIGRVISAILGITGSVAILMFVYGGFMMLTSAGIDQKIVAAKKIITWAIIGIMVILGSYAIVTFIFQGLTGK